MSHSSVYLLARIIFTPYSFDRGFLDVSEVLIPEVCLLFYISAFLDGWPSVKRRFATADNHGLLRIIRTRI